MYLGGNGPEAHVVASADRGRTWNDANDPRGALPDASFGLVADAKYQRVSMIETRDLTKKYGELFAIKSINLKQIS